MLILSDFSTQCYSLEDQQSQPAPAHQQLCPAVFFGHFNSHQFLIEQNIKVVITCGSVISSIKQYNETSNNSILMLIVDENFQISSHSGEELDLIMDFQMRQAKLLQEVNEKFNTNSKISVPFITSKLLVTLQNLNLFLKNFKTHYPNLSVLINFGNGNKVATVIALSYLIYLQPKSNVTTLFFKLQNLNPKIDSNLLLDTYYNDVLVKFWESNYLLEQNTAADKRSLSDGSNDDLKRKRV